MADPAEAGGLHLAAGRDHVEQDRYAGFGHAEMVNAELWQFRQPVDMRPERRGIGIDFGVLAGDRVDAGCQCCDVIDAVDPAAE